jgi:hypothetical protein
MGTVAETAFRTLGSQRQQRWQGRSGRFYALVGLGFDSFAMDGADLYLIAKGGHVLWVGSAGDLVADPLSRSRFRLALDCGDRVFRLATDTAEAERWSTVWDLEGAEPLPEAVAA